jgi:hypothetical protein
MLTSCRRVQVVERAGKKRKMFYGEGHPKP